ncbi:hypothetical protein RhiJN_03531 [Ceratobasidium sp. AG-Ba]|nr:hypothetical protein RhiJN_03531 [Ceratobasidium sp. AG-Ba]
MIALMTSIIYAVVVLQNLLSFGLAMPARTPTLSVPTLEKRTKPYFPEYPPSCPKCQAEFDNINSCADASAALADPQSIILNPSGFYDLIKCSCTDTFQSAFPQCVDCFIQTNQTSVLDANTADLPSVVSGMREVCSLASVLLGGVASANSQVASSTSSAPTAAATSGCVPRIVILRSYWLALFSAGSLALYLVIGA